MAPTRSLSKNTTRTLRYVGVALPILVAIAIAVVVKLGSSSTVQPPLSAGPPVTPAVGAAVGQTFAAGELPLTNRAEKPLVIDSVTAAATSGYRVLNAYAYLTCAGCFTTNAYPPVVEAPSGPNRATRAAIGFKVPPGAATASLIVGLRITRAGSYPLPRLRVGFHVGAKHYVVTIKRQFTFCAPAARCAAVN